MADHIPVHYKHTPQDLLDNPRTVLFGFWASRTQKHFPEVFVGDHDNTECVRELREINPGIIQYRGMHGCRICGKVIGSRTNVLAVDDDIWAWPEGLAHYLEEHGVEPPQEMLQMLSRRYRFKQYLEDGNGYYNIKELHGKLVGLLSFALTTGLVVGIDRTGYSRRYCYEFEDEAKAALEAMDNHAEHPSGNWIKCKGTYKGLPVDLLNPNLEV